MVKCGYKLNGLRQLAFKGVAVKTGWTRGYWQRSGLKGCREIGCREMGYNLLQTWQGFQKAPGQALLPPGQADSGACKVNRVSSTREGTECMQSNLDKNNNNFQSWSYQVFVCITEYYIRVLWGGGWADKPYCLHCASCNPLKHGAEGSGGVDFEWFN